MQFCLVPVRSRTIEVITGSAEISRATLEMSRRKWEGLIHPSNAGLATVTAEEFLGRNVSC